MSASKVNGKRAALSKELKSHDIVEIEYKSSSKPSQKWLSYVQTNVAKRHIRNYLKRKNMNLLQRLIN